MGALGKDGLAGRAWAQFLGSGTLAWVKRHRTWLLVFSGIAFLYLYFIPYFPALNNPNENARVYQIRAAVELKKFSVNEQISKYGPVNDLGVREGKFYSGKAPGTTFLGVPIYWALRGYERWKGHEVVHPFRLTYALRFAGTLVPVLSFVYVFRRFLAKIVEEPVANVLAVLLALGTMLLPYALIFVNHSLTAATAFGTVMAVHAAVEARDHESRVGWRAWAWLAVAGFLLAYTACLDYALLPVAVFLLVYVFARFGLGWASVVGTSFGGLIPSLLTAWYHKVCWGSPFKLSTSFLATPEFAANHSTGVFGIVGPEWSRFVTLTFSPAKGLLYFSPFLALAVPAGIYACVKARGWRREAALSLWLVLWMILFNASLINWDAGWTVGPRYETAMLPFGVFALALAWRELGPKARAVVVPVVSGLGIASMAAITSTSVMFPHIPPQYVNPVREIIWPIWRDAITPTSFGRRWLGLHGRGDQVPFLVVFACLAAYLLWFACRRWLRPVRHPWLAQLGSLASAAAILACALWVGTLAHTEPRKVVDDGAKWIRSVVWHPRLPKEKIEASSRDRSRRP